MSTSEREITEKIASLCISHSELWAKEKAQKLRDAVLRNPFQKNLYQSHLFNLEMLVKIVLQYQEHQFPYSYSVIQNITMLKNELLFKSSHGCNEYQSCKGNILFLELLVPENISSRFLIDCR